MANKKSKKKMSKKVSKKTSKKATKNVAKKAPKKKSNVKTWIGVLLLLFVFLSYIAQGVLESSPTQGVSILRISLIIAAIVLFILSYTGKK